MFAKPNCELKSLEGITPKFTKVDCCSLPLNALMLKSYGEDGVNADGVRINVVELLPPAGGVSTLLTRVAFIDEGNPLIARVTVGVCELIETTCTLTDVLEPGVMGEIALGVTVTENVCPDPTIWNGALATIESMVTVTG